MARTPDPDTLRLTAIDPTELGRAITAALAKHVARLAVPLSPGVTVHVGAVAGDSTVGLAATDLARYARGEGRLDGPVQDYAVELVPLLAGPLADPGEIPPILRAWLDGEVNLSDLRADSLPDRLALVLTAALGREAMESGQPVTAAQLAALAGLDPNSLRRLARFGEIQTADHGAIPAAEARRWLAGRAR